MLHWYELVRAMCFVILYNQDQNLKTEIKNSTLRSDHD